MPLPTDCMFAARTTDGNRTVKNAQLANKMDELASSFHLSDSVMELRDQVRSVLHKYAHITVNALNRASEVGRYGFTVTDPPREVGYKRVALVTLTDTWRQESVSLNFQGLCETWWVTCEDKPSVARAAMLGCFMEKVMGHICACLHDEVRFIYESQFKLAWEDTTFLSAPKGGPKERAAFNLTAARRAKMTPEQIAAVEAERENRKRNRREYERRPDIKAHRKAQAAAREVEKEKKAAQEAEKKSLRRIRRRTINGQFQPANAEEGIGAREGAVAQLGEQAVHAIPQAEADGASGHPAA